MHRGGPDKESMGNVKNKKQDPAPNHHYNYPKKTNMAMENPPFEDVFPIENGDFPLPC